MWASDTSSWAWSLSHSYPWTKHLNKWVWQQTRRILRNPSDTELKSNWLMLEAVSVSKNQWELCHKQPSSENLKLQMNSSLLQSISRFQQLGAKQLERNLKQVSRQISVSKYLLMCRRRRVHCSCSVTCTCAHPATCQGGEVKSIKAARSNWQGTEGPILEPGCGTITTCPTQCGAGGGHEGMRWRDQENNNHVKQELLNCLPELTGFCHEGQHTRCSLLADEETCEHAVAWNSLQLKETWLNFFRFNLLHFLNHFLKRPTNTELWYY